MPFVPPQFGDIGKKAKDVLSKKYDYRNEAKVVKKSSGGLTFDSGATFGKSDNYIKGTYKCGDFGEAEAELHTAADTKAKVKFDKFAAGSAVTLSVSSKPDVNVEATYTRDMLATQVKLTHAETSLGVSASASLGMDGYTAGVSSVVDLTGGNVALKDLCFGAEARYGDIIAAAKTAKNNQNKTLSVYYKLSSVLALGASVDATPKATGLALGSEYALSKTTGVKARAASTGAVGVVVEHKLADPALKLAMSAEFDATNYGAPANKFGLSFVFGDY